MTQTQGIMLVLPLAVGLAAIIGTILIQGMALSALIDFVRKEKRLGHAGTNGGRMFGSLLDNVTDARRALD